MLDDPVELVMGLIIVAAALLAPFALAAFLIVYCKAFNAFICWLMSTI